MMLDWSCADQDHWFVALVGDACIALVAATAITAFAVVTGLSRRQDFATVAAQAATFLLAATIAGAMQVFVIETTILRISIPSICRTAVAAEVLA
jgi:hypothetical protein